MEVNVSKIPFNTGLKFQEIIRIERLTLLSSDVFFFFVSFLIARSIRLENASLDFFLFPQVYMILLVSITVMYVLDLYRTDLQVFGLRAPSRAILACLIIWVMVAVFTYFYGSQNFVDGIAGRGVFLIFCIAYSIFTSSSRFLLQKKLNKYLTLSHWVAIGKPKDFAKFKPDLENSRFKSLVVFVEIGSTNGKVDIEAYIKKGFSGFILGESIHGLQQPINQLMKLRLRGVRVYDLESFYEQMWFKIPIFDLEDTWFAVSRGFSLLHNPLALRLKRVFDLLLAILLLLTALPVMAVTGLLIKISDGGPIMFRQLRTGQFDKNFDVLKFRTMTVNAEKNGAQWAVKNDTRVTKVGKIIRLTRIDELPQLINVIRGEMSFIGPRPERPEFNQVLNEKIPYYNVRHLVKPGITGWAQVLYPYGASVEDAIEKLQYDLYYIKNFSLFLDFAIVLKTVRVVLLGKGQ